MNNALNIVQQEWKVQVLEPYFENLQETTLSKAYYMGVSDEYINSNNRIMIIGQETRGGGEYDPDQSIHGSRKWGINYLRKQIYNITPMEETIKPNRSAFWKFFRKFDEYGFTPCWNNIDKIQQNINNQTHRLTYEMESHFCKQYGDEPKSLIQREIEICVPNSIVFITGPNYTHPMAISFGIDEKLLKKQHLCIDNPIVDITDIFNFGIKAVWTYHPTFLNRKHIFNEVSNKIIELL